MQPHDPSSGVADSFLKETHLGTRYDWGGFLFAFRLNINSPVCCSVTLVRSGSKLGNLICPFYERMDKIVY